MVREITLNSEKSEVLFYKIKSLIASLNMLAGVLQNPGHVNEHNCKENLEKFNKEYEGIIKRLAVIKQEVENLHGEIK